MYLPQQQPPAGHYNVAGPGFAPYQPYANVAQPQIIRQQYTGPGSHHYPQAGQIMPMNAVTGAAGTNAAIPPGIMHDNSAILAATTQPHMHYMPNTPTMLPQQPQQHHMQPPAPAAAAKQSKAIKIVNPETMKEVDTSNLKKTSPASSARSTPKPNSESEQVQQQFKQTVNRAVDLKGNDVAKQPAVTPNAIIRQPNQQEQYNVAMVTGDPVETKPASHDTEQSSDVSQLPSDSGVHQKEPVSTAVAGDSEVEQSAEVSSISDSDMLPQQQLPQQQLPKAVEDHFSSSSNISTEEVKEEVANEPVDNTKIIQQFDEQLHAIRDVVDKPEDVTMDTVNAVEDLSSHGDYQPIKQDMEKPDAEKPTDSEKLVTGDIDSECPNELEHDSVVDFIANTSSMEISSIEKDDTEMTSMEIISTENSNIQSSMEELIMEELSMEKPIMEELSMEKPSMEELSMKKPTMEEPSMEEHDMEEVNTQVHSVKKEVGIEDKCAGEEDTGESNFIGESTGPSSLEDMSTTQGVYYLYVV